MVFKDRIDKNVKQIMQSCLLLHLDGAGRVDGVSRLLSISVF